MENSEAEEQKKKKPSVNSLTRASSAAAVEINLPTHKTTLGMTQHEREKIKLFPLRNLFKHLQNIFFFSSSGFFQKSDGRLRDDGAAHGHVNRQILFVFFFCLALLLLVLVLGLGGRSSG